MAGKFEFLKDGNISFDDLVRVRVDDDNNVEYPEDVFGRSFPLRQIAPGAVEFMVSQNRLTVPQRRSILGFLKNEDIKPTDAAAFYEFYFDIVEAHPVKAAFLEIGAISATKTNPRKINNKPVGALPLSERSDAQCLFGQLNDPQPPVELLVGLFFDYVRENYTALNQAYDNPQDAFDKIFAEELTASDTDEEDFEDIIEELVDQEVSELAEAREKLIVSDQEASLVAEFARRLNASDLDPAKHFHLRLAAAEYLVARIGSKANPHIYDTVIALVEAARDQEAKPDTKNAETILQRLGTAGFDISDSTTAWVRKHTFTVLAPLIDRVCFLSLAFSEVRKKADQAFKTYTNEVHERLAAGDMSGVQSAAANAQTAGEQVDAAKAQEYTLFNDLPALFEDLNKDPEDLDAFLNGLDTSVIDAFGLQPNRVSTPFVETEVIPNSDTDVSDAEFEVETVGDNADDNIQAKADAGTPEMSLEDSEEEGAVGTTDNETVPQGKASPKAAPDDHISPEMTSSDEAEPETKKFITEDVVLTPSPALALEEYQEEVFEEEDASSALPVSDENRDLIIEALNSDAPAIAAAVSDAVQHQGKKPMIRGSVFRALSASRAVGFEYSPSTDQLVRLMSEGAGEDTEPEALLRFAAAIRTAVFVPEANLRPVIANLNLGSFGPELGSDSHAYNVVLINFFQNSVMCDSLVVIRELLKRDRNYQIFFMKILWQRFFRGIRESFLPRM